MLIYKNYYKSLKTLSDYNNRAMRLRNKEKSLNILRKALSLDKLSSIEKASLFLDIGILHYGLKQYKEAVLSFDEAFKLSKDHKFLYEKKFQKVIKAYIYANEKEKAKKLIESLASREYYDSNFKKIKSLIKLI